VKGILKLAVLSNLGIMEERPNADGSRQVKPGNYLLG